ncbi:magnesium and cobalt transport protein CorA [uncultured Streptomyces sp.]|uniref:magnesium and cobalt transport protein CorA n=1 Tax=uncultured Streptomyces sp. TaxID=174707 RepID=UPI00260FFF0B|nr:magnesium and cobalt transport protein CorA [uncultured Streptomyces sp.]
MIRTIRRAVSRVIHRKIDLSHPARSPLGSSVVNCVTYVDGVRRFGPPSAGDALRGVRAAGRGFVWLGLHEPSNDELLSLAGEFGLHPLAVEAAGHGRQRPRTEEYDGVLLSVFKTCLYVEHERLTETSEVVDTGELVVLTGPDFVITVRHGGHGSLGPLREALEADPVRLARGPAAVLHAVADQVVDDYLRVADAIQLDVEAVETSVFAGRPQREDAGRIYQLKRELTEFKRAVLPLDRPLHVLATRRSACVDDGVRPYFPDVAEHLTRTTEQIAGYDALLDSVFQAHLAQVTVAQNEDMRRITAWAAIIAVPTMVCGVYGMNFAHMPELRWTYGYPAALGLMAVACFVIHRGFRRNGWL